MKFVKFHLYDGNPKIVAVDNIESIDVEDYNNEVVAVLFLKSTRNGNVNTGVYLKESVEEAYNILNRDF